MSSPIEPSAEERAQGHKVGPASAAPAAGVPGAPEVASAPLRRPGAVTWGLGIQWFGVVLSVVLTFMIAPALASQAPELAGSEPLIILVSLGLAGVQALILVFAGRGKKWARLLLAILVGLGIGAQALTGTLSVGTAVGALSIVLLYLRPSSDWYDARS